MNSLSICLSLVSCGVLDSVDGDAAAYIAAVESAKGSGVSGAQRSAINSFIASEKAASRWSSQKRLFFPIWANAAANAIDMATLATGTFVNSPTHSAGYVQGNGSTQYFNTGASASTIGLTMGSCGSTVLMPANTTALASPWGAFNGSDQVGLYCGGTQCSDTVGQAQQLANLATTARTGILSFERVGTTHSIYRRTSSGIVTLVSSTVAAAGSIPTTNNIYLLAANSGAGASNYWNGPIGAFSLHSSFDASNTSAFTSNLKSMWEACTGLSIL